MFQDDYFGDEQGSYEKKINVYLNGDFLQKPVAVKAPKRMKDIRRAVQEPFGFVGTKVFRLFNEKGVELFEEDLEFLEDGVSVYASKGAEFDTNSCLSEYHLEKELGEGGFGKVWLGVHKQTKEKVAIKILNTSHIQNASEMDQVFREAEVMQTLEHAHIVQIKSCFSIRQQVVFIMEFMQGGELLERVEKATRFDEQEAQIYFKQICSAMEYCHRLKLIHRDLKLENLLCTNTEEKICKVADFGIAGVASNQSSDNIDAGSLRYMAPEVLSGRLKVPSTAVDIWSMGVILFAMLVGDLPFNGKDNREIVENICLGEYTIPKDIKKKLSPQCLEVLDLCLELDYTKRITAGKLMQHTWVKDHTLENFMKQENEEEDQNEVNEINEGTKNIKLVEEEEEKKEEVSQKKQQYGTRNSAYNSKYGSSNIGSKYGQKPTYQTKQRSTIGGSTTPLSNTSKGSTTTKNSLTQNKNKGSSGTTPKTPGQTKTFTYQSKVATKSKY